MTLQSILQYIAFAGVGVIGYFLKGMMAQFKAEVDKSRSNERELYGKLEKETRERLEQHICILKDQLVEARKR